MAPSTYIGCNSNLDIQQVPQNNGILAQLASALVSYESMICLDGRVIQRS